MMSGMSRGQSVFPSQGESLFTAGTYELILGFDGRYFVGPANRSADYSGCADMWSWVHSLIVFWTVPEWEQ